MPPAKRHVRLAAAVAVCCGRRRAAMLRPPPTTTTWLSGHKTAHSTAASRGWWHKGGRLSAGVAGARPWLGCIPTCLTTHYFEARCHRPPARQFPAFHRSSRAPSMSMLALMRGEADRASRNTHASRAVKLLGREHITGRCTAIMKSASVRSRAFFRYREMTVGQGEGCADLVRRAPPGHRASAAQTGRPVQSSVFWIPEAVHRP
jgi:hypothetical protein